jgi:hypothetical protein
MTTNKYILDENGKPRAEADVMKWACWYENANRRVAETWVGKFCVSTVFLGIDHSWNDSPPILWESMVFDEKNNEIALDRCAGSREQAEAMHELMVLKFSREKRNDTP